MLKAPETEVTVLENGFKVVTERRQGETAAVGVFIGAGSRHETKENNGVAHFLEHMYFKGTPSRSGQQLEDEYETAGAQLNAHTAREYTCFTSHCLHNDVERSVDSISDIILNSKISPEDIQRERGTILREAEEVETQIEEVLFDKLHEGAFQLSPLGYTILGPRENIQHLTRAQMIQYRDTFYTAPRMVLVGVGDINHQDFVGIARKYFQHLPSTPKNNYDDQMAEAQYVGGSVKVHDENIPFLYQAISFQGPPMHSPDILPMNIIQVLLGSWDKTAGSGKFIQSPLCHYVADLDLARSITSFSHAYSDTSLFGVQSVSDGTDEGGEGKTSMLTSRMVKEMTKFCYRVKAEDVTRAKNILKNHVVQSYEGRLDEACEDIGKQMIFYGRRPSAFEMFMRIDLITPEQVMAVAQKYILDQDPACVHIGRTFWVTDYNVIRNKTYSWKQN